jgi:hypothetical protein
MRSWSEFRSGADYNVELATADGSERVSVSVVATADEGVHVRVHGSSAGVLFERFLGRVTYALAEHSDNLMVDRII